MEEYWWSSGPTLRSPYEPLHEVQYFDGSMNMEELPDELLGIHTAFMEEPLSRNYPYLLKSDPKGFSLTYASKCKQKRVTVCKEHIGQPIIQTIMREYRDQGCVSGHLVMYGLYRPTILTLYLDEL